MLRYTVFNARPTGRMWHGPGDPSSAEGLSRYHEANSLRGVRYAAEHGFAWIDLDVMVTKDGVLVCNHSFGFMAKEGFRDPLGRIRGGLIDRLTWAAVRRMRARKNYRVQPLERMLAECARLGIGAALDLKGDAREGYRLAAYLEEVAEIANRTGARVYVKTDRRRLGLRRMLRRARELGFWARYNGVGRFLPPL